MTDEIEFSLYTPDEKWIMTETPIYRSPTSNEPVILQLDNITGRVYGISLYMDSPDLQVQLLMDGIERSINNSTPDELFDMGFRGYNPVFPYTNEYNPLGWHFTPLDDRLARFTQTLKLSVAVYIGVEIIGKAIWLKRPDSS